MSFSGEWNYPVELPVVERREEIVKAIRENQVVVVVSDTGSGKTTQLPKMVAEALEVSNFNFQTSSDGETPSFKPNTPKKRKRLIGCTQPRRIAAVSVAKRVAEELRVPLGDFVGYQVRFDDKTSRETRVKFMTDGILLAETQGDTELKKYDALILDEAHERSLNIDFLLGYLKRLLARRKDLRVVISSATLDAGAFAEFFAGLGSGAGIPANGLGQDAPATFSRVPVIEAPGRMFPVEEFYLPGKDDEDLSSLVGRGVDEVTGMDPMGDVLVFLPGEREIREAADLLEGRRYRNTEVLPLFARLGMGDQQRVFQPGNLRRIVLATNVAETSLTIPRIACVVDTGLARVSRWNATKGVQRLMVEAVSQASARQRKGRCGRVQEGICLRLFEEEELLERPEFTEPEIRRSSLAGVILRMKALGLPEISEFPFLDPPNAKAVAEGYRTLREVGALDKDRELTEIGMELGRLPVDPRMGRMLIEARVENCVEEVLVIVAGLETSDPKERPAEKKREADAAHAKWQDPDSDFMAMLNLWKDVSEYYDGRRWKWNQLRKFCGRYFLNAKRVTEWGNVISELSELTDHKLSNFNSQTSRKRDGGGVNVDVFTDYGAVHRALLAGAPKAFGLWDKENRAYRGASGGFFAVFPGSGLFGLKKRNEWVMGLEMVETTRLWARRVARIEPEWVEVVAPHLCRSRYGEAYWDEKQGAVYGKESVICGGLHVIEGRRVHYGRVDKKAAHGVFLREGILGRGMRRRARFLDHMEAMKEEIKGLEDKLRRPGMLWSDDAVVSFFEKRIPGEISTASAFNKWLEGNEEGLMLGMADVVWEELDGLEFFPDTLKHGGEEYPVYYHCAPGERDDGVTLGVHVDQLPGLPVWLPGWGMDGNLEERVELLLRGLPKDYRRACQPIGEVARGFAELWMGAPKEGAIEQVLAGYVREKTGAMVPVGEFSFERLPEALVTKIWVCDDDADELAMGEDVAELKLQLADRMKVRFEAVATADVERRGMSKWDGESLPEEVMTAGGATYPALVDEGGTVGVRAFADFYESREAHRGGGARLLILAAEGEVNYLKKKFPMGMLAKVEMGRMGVELEDLLLLTAEGVAGGVFPRSPEGFAKLAEDTRGRWYEVASKIGVALDGVAEAALEVRGWIEANRGDRNFGEVARDLEEEVSWLMRGRWVWRGGYERVVDYPRYFRAIRSRLGRVKSLPLVKDLEKMDLVRGYWEGWYAAWIGASDDASLWEAGWLLEEWRVQVFAPDVEVRGKVSEKRVEKALEWLVPSDQ
ncbi:MAG: ATP-dependent RNA helicase HrpA [Luteolibacter sp.]